MQLNQIKGLKYEKNKIITIINLLFHYLTMISSAICMLLKLFNKNYIETSIYFICTICWVICSIIQYNEINEFKEINI